MKKKWLGRLLVFMFVFCLMPGFGTSAKAAKNLFNITMMYPGNFMDQIHLDGLKGVPGKNIKISYSKKGIVKLTAIKETYDGRKWPGTYDVFPRKAGTTIIKFTVTRNGKKVTYQGKVKVLKYKNPFKTFKIDGKSYLAALKKVSKDYNGYPYKDIKLSTSEPRMKVEWKLKPDWKVLYASKAHVEDDMLCGDGKLRNGKKFSVSAETQQQLEISLQHRITKASMTVTIYVN